MILQYFKEFIPGHVWLTLPGILPLNLLNLYMYISKIVFHDVIFIFIFNLYW